MAIVGGFDIHRRQVTFDYLDTVTGQIQRGRISPACRQELRSWLSRFAGRADVTFAVEGCTGWRFVVEELQRAGITALLAEPAETARQRGLRKRAKTGRADARHLRALAAEGRLPTSWIPPEQARELRALLQLYRDLAEEHTAWPQRIHATLFCQGVPGMAHRLNAAGARAALAGGKTSGCRPRARRPWRWRCAGWRTWRPSSRRCGPRSPRSRAASLAAGRCSSSCSAWDRSWPRWCGRSWVIPAGSPPPPRPSGTPG